MSNILDFNCYISPNLAWASGLDILNIFIFRATPSVSSYFILFFLSNSFFSFLFLLLSLVLLHPRIIILSILFSSPASSSGSASLFLFLNQLNKVHVRVHAELVSVDCESVGISVVVVGSESGIAGKLVHFPFHCCPICKDHASV